MGAYKKLQSKKGWTAGQCGNSPSPSPSPTGSCSAEIFKNKQYKYKKSDLISKSKSKNVNDCLKTCYEANNGCVGVNWSRKKCYQLSKVNTLKKKKGWTAATCA